MYYWIGMDCVAIAANAGIPVSTSTSRLQLARRAFRQAWLSHFDPY
jgi:DNA-directed RNA polymerase specialized sigma24 family protein